MNLEIKKYNSNSIINKSIKGEENEKNSYSNSSIIIKTNKIDNDDPLVFSDTEKTETKKENSINSNFKNRLRKARDKYKNKKATIKYQKNLGITIEGVNLDQVDEEKRNILHKACLQLKLSIVKDLIPKLSKEYVNKKDKYGNTPLILACKLPVSSYLNERNQIINILINSGADIECVEPINGWTALHWCCFNGDLLSSKTLINCGANFFLPSNHGYFPIDLAGEKNEDLVKDLIVIAIFYLEKIGNYELLTEKINQENLKLYNMINSNFLINNSSNNEENNNDSKKVNIKYISNFEKITKTVFLRLYTEHCLYWASFYNCSDDIINKLLYTFYAHSDFHLFCQENRTAMHAACIKGNKEPFEILLNHYKGKKEKREKLYGKKKAKIPINMINTTETNKVYNIIYPYEYQNFKKIFESNNNTFNKKFKKYLSEHFFELIYPKSYIEYLPFEKILDNEGNTPIVLAAKNNQYDFFYFIQEKELIKNIDAIFNLDNKVGYCGYYYLKDLSFKNNLIRNSKKIYPIPPVVLELNRNESTKTSINLIMKIGVSEKLEIELMQHIDNDHLYILININENYFYQQAEKDKLHIKLLNKNLKLPFENNSKYIASVEPFLSRHYQYIITKTLANLLDIQTLKDQNILNDIFLTHNPNVTTKIYNTIIKQKFYWPNPLCYIHDYFFEGKNINYYQIQLLYRYFGQAISMYYAFYGFFTVMYGPLALVSLIYTIIYLKSLFNGNDMYPVFFIIFAVWNLLTMSKWKRKSEEIQHKWGMKISQDQQKMRIEFKGDEYYSDLDAPLEKFIDSITFIKSFFLGFPLILLFIGLIIISSYFVTVWEDSVQNETNYFFKFFPSLIRALSLVIIFDIYDYFISYVTNLENIKYEDDFENTLILRVFLFRLIVDFISIFYNVFFTKNIYRLKVLLYTNILMRFIIEIIVRILYPIISNHLSRRIYFKKVSKKLKHHFMKKKSIDKEDKNSERIDLKSSENLNLKINKNENIENKDDKNNEYIEEVYNRVSMITGNTLSYEKNIDISNIDPDFIEIQSSLKQKRNLLYDYEDIFMIHSLISQFIIIIPFGPLICFFFSIFSQNARLYVDIFYLKRPPSLSCRGIKLWNRILEFNSIFMTVTNCFLYYYYGNNNYIREKVAKNTEFNISSNEAALIVIVCAEHVIVIIQYLLKYSIPEVPKWVSKERENLIGYYTVLSTEKEIKENNELTRAIKTLKYRKEQLTNEISEQKRILREYDENLVEIRSKLLQKDGKLKEYSDALGLLYNSARKRIFLSEKMSYPRIRTLVYNTKKEKENIKLDDFYENLDRSNLEYFYSFKKIQNFIDIKFDFILQKLVNEISPNNSSLFQFKTYKSFNFENKNFDDWKKDIRKAYCFYKMKNTLDSIENIILTKKLQFFLNHNNSPLIICSACGNNIVEFKCENCNELFCPKCKTIHVSNILWEEHKITYYILPLKKNINKDAMEISFIKGESFSFPTSMANNFGYKNLINLFDLLYIKYITNNGINNDNKINFKEEIFQKVDFFMKLETVPSKVIEEQIEFLSGDDISFNLTELFFINRICFKNFKYFGAKTTTDRVYLPLKFLEISTFEKKIVILLNLLDIYDNKLILKNEIIKFFVFIGYQSFTEEFSIDNIIQDIFKTNNDYIEFSELYKIIIYTPKLSSIFKYLLQCNNDNDEKISNIVI